MRILATSSVQSHCDGKTHNTLCDLLLLSIQRKKQNPEVVYVKSKESAIEDLFFFLICKHIASLRSCKYIAVFKLKYIVNTFVACS